VVSGRDDCQRGEDASNPDAALNDGCDKRISFAMPFDTKTGSGQTYMRKVEEKRRFITELKNGADTAVDEVLVWKTLQRLVREQGKAAVAAGDADAALEVWKPAFLSQVYTKHGQFTKTGSGQT
jgi:hypothetical protein